MKNGDIKTALEEFRLFTRNQNVDHLPSEAEKDFLKNMAAQIIQDQEDSGLSSKVAAALRLASLRCDVPYESLIREYQSESSDIQDASGKGAVFKFDQKKWLHFVKVFGEEFGLGDLADRIQEKVKGETMLVYVHDKETLDRIMKLQENPLISAALGARAIQNADNLPERLSYRGISAFELPESPLAPNPRTSKLLEIAMQLKGMNEREHEAEISRFIKKADFGIDPQKTAWCAAYVNAVLHSAGIQGTGRLNARSFLDFGKEVTEPKPGDIAVFRRGGPGDEIHGHVGFVFRRYWLNGGWKVDIVGGNQGRKGEVSISTRNEKDLLGYRRVDLPEVNNRLSKENKDRRSPHNKGFDA